MKVAAVISVMVAVSAVLILFNSRLKSNLAHSTLEQKHPLTLFCAAGLKQPVEEVVKAYEKEHGINVEVQYGGSGTLLSNLRVVRQGDLFLSADESYIQEATSHGLVAQTFTVAYQSPVIAVQAGNPKRINSLEDFRRQDVRIALANPESASIGKLSRKILESQGRWEEIKARAKVFKPTVQEVASDTRMGIVDAGIVWEATVKQNRGLEAVPCPLLESHLQSVTLAVLKSSKDPTATLHFARYLLAKDRGLMAFEKDGYKIIQGEPWS